MSIEKLITERAAIEHRFKRLQEEIVRLRDDTAKLLEACRGKQVGVNDESLRAWSAVSIVDDKLRRMHVAAGD